MSVEDKIEKIRKNIMENTNLVEDNRKGVEKNRIKIKYNKNIVLDKKAMAYKDKNSNYKYRFLLECKLYNGDNKKALFIMKNPSMADENWSDNTVNRVLETMYNFNYSIVYIMNLIPEYTPNPKQLHIDSIPKDILKINYELMSILSKEVSKVFVAWGNNNGIRIRFYNRIIKSVKKLLKESTHEKKVCCYCFNNSGQPRHPGRALWWNTKKKECKYKIWPCKSKNNQKNKTRSRNN